MTIQLLTNDTIGKIAAGEVVERPASVVKELLENALDAGATAIAIEIVAGGMERIEVSDDGQGIPFDELRVAVQRHATSKLQTFEDLDALATLGFRGEALPSIAAVSMFSLRSRPGWQEHGGLLQIDFGNVASPLPRGASAGTTVTVEQLFGNVPARRKFLRQASTESSAIGRMVASYAAAYPRVRFSLTVDGRRSFSTDGSGDLTNAAAGAWGPETGAAALLLEPLEESAAVPGISVEGWIGAPSLNRSHRQHLIFFVNGRLIQNRALSFALEEAYHSLLMVGRHPVALVKIQLDPATVDVNVHPTKAEVKFEDERAVCRAVSRAAHAALTTAPRDELPRVGFRPIPSEPNVRQEPLQIETRTFANHHVPVEEPHRPAAPKTDLPVLRVLGQVGASYIIAEGPDGLYLIDQHAAHERVMYEKILAALSAGFVEKQPYLDPLVIDLNAEERAVFDKSSEELTTVGFEIESFGEGSVVVRAIPAMMAGVDIRERLSEILKELSEGGAGDSWLDSVAISAACHTSIRANQALSLPEMRELVAQLERTAFPRACGHGRPTMLLMSQTDLEKQFSRR
jgi:DNA mismatch repair protein MutL